MSAHVRVRVRMLGRVLGVCVLGGIGIRDRLRGKWTAGRQAGGRKKGGRDEGREDGEAGQLWQQPVA